MSEFDELIKMHGCKQIEISGKMETIHFMKPTNWSDSDTDYNDD